jgi:hypothetical protein
MSGWVLRGGLAALLRSLVALVCVVAAWRCGGWSGIGKSIVTALGACGTVVGVSGRLELRGGALWEQEAVGYESRYA